MTQFLNPNEVLRKLQLRNDMLAADFGSGSGGFGIALAKILEKGTVYALDIQQAPLSALKSRASLENISNIKTIVCDLDKPKSSTLPADSLDLVIISDMLFQTEDKKNVLTEAKRIINQDGRLVVIDWLPDSALGPVGSRVSPDEIIKTALSVGLELKERPDAGSYHYCLIFKKI